MKVTIFGFTACRLPKCDCGCQIFLGLSHESARALLQWLRESGHEVVSLSEESLDITERGETGVLRVYPGASADLEIYVKDTKEDWEI